MERLQKYMARCGAASRRKCEEYITQGRVKVNGQTVTQLGTTVSASDKVELDGKLLQEQPKYVYIMLNKPEKVMSTSIDPGRPRNCYAAYRPSVSLISRWPIGL